MEEGVEREPTSCHKIACPSCFIWLCECVCVCLFVRGFCCFYFARVYSAECYLINSIFPPLAVVFKSFCFFSFQQLTGTFLWLSCPCFCYGGRGITRTSEIENQANQCLKFSFFPPKKEKKSLALTIELAFIVDVLGSVFFFL